MESTILESLFLPWWKGLLYILALTVSAVTIRLTINFDLNEFLKRRRQIQLTNAMGKLADKCRHAWTLYPDGPYSHCALCQAWIATSFLLAMQEHADVKPVIFEIHPGVVVSQKGEYIVVNDYIGGKS